MRPALRPGLQILRRDVRSFQLGHEWPGVAALIDTPVVRAVLAAVDGYRDRSAVLRAATDALTSDAVANSTLTAEALDTDALAVDPLAADPLGTARDRTKIAAAVRATLDGLVVAGVIVDQADTRRPADVDEASWASLWLLAGPGRTASELHLAHRACSVAVQGSGRVAGNVSRLIAEAGMPLAANPASADVVVVASDSPPDRAVADEAMRGGLPHLWAYVCDLVGFVGPFVQPGRSACLRCVDSSRANRDPAWPTVVASSAVRRLPVAACDATLAAVVAALAVQQVSLWACGIRPHTLGAVLEVPHGMGPVESSPYHPHPLCGCGWTATWHDTMGA